MIRKTPDIDDARGFTLLELTVVVALIGIVLIFAMPRVDAMMAGRSVDRIARRVCLATRQLRVDAIRLQETHRLLVDLDAQRIRWRRDMPPETVESPAKGLILSGKSRILDVVDSSGRKTVSGEAAIRFHPAGYADMALIHMKGEDQRVLTLRIEPFLTRCFAWEGYLGLEDRTADHGI